MTIMRRRRSDAAFAVAPPEVCWLAFFVCSALLVSANKTAAQGGGAPQRPANAVPCDAFRKNPDGSWTATRAVSVNVGSGTVSVGANTTFAPHAIRLNDVDFANFLDGRCGKQDL